MEQNPLERREQLEVNVRVATEKDLEQIKSLRLEAVKNSPSSFDEEPSDILERSDEGWKNLLVGAQEFLIVGEKGNEIFGMLSAAKDESFSYKKGGRSIKNVWYIRWGYLKPELQKKPAGFAIKGLEKCLEEIRHRGGEAAVLMIRAKNENKESIVKIGQKFGFQSIESIARRILRPGSVFMRLEFANTNAG